MKPWDITPPPREEHELRVIVWETKDVKFKDTVTECNDLYARATWNRQSFETDTHWRCRTKGSFNWRMKWRMQLPINYDEEFGNDVLTISLWDRDIVTSNEMIAETRIDLNDHNMLRKYVGAFIDCLTCVVAIQGVQTEEEGSNEA